jgi:hypothetical protein
MREWIVQNVTYANRRRMFEAAGSIPSPLGFAQPKSVDNA